MNKNDKMVSREKAKAKLLEQLQELEEEELQDHTLIEKTISEVFNDDLVRLAELSRFRAKGKVQATLTYEMDFDMQAFNYDIDDETWGDGDVYVDLKLPRGYHLAPFFSDDSICNVCMSGLEGTICPENKTQLKEFKALEKKIEKDLLKLAKKNGWESDMAFELLDKAYSAAWVKSNKR